MSGHDLERQPGAAAKAETPTPEGYVGQEHHLLSLQQTAGNAAVSAAIQRQRSEGVTPSPALGVLGRGGGRPLDGEVRREFEGALGGDFTDVRIHDDAPARSSAAAVGAHAFTSGNEIVFGEGAYAPGTEEGHRTLAHELTHVLQQRRGPVTGTDSGDGVAVSDPGDAFEQEATSHTEHVLATGAAPGINNHLQSLHSEP